MPKQKNWLLCGFAQICRPTRSGSGTTKASRQVLPLIRTLLGPLVCGLQARLRTFPENDSLGTRGDEMVCIQSGGQKRRIQVSLDRANATTTVMPTLRKWFFHARSTAMTPLREFTGACGDFDQGAARTRPRCASKMLQTSLVLEAPRSCHSVSATLCRKSFRG